MMRFLKISEDILEALVEFCSEQNCANSYVSEDEIETLVESAIVVMNKIPESKLPVVKLYQYNMFAGVEFTDEILPKNIKEKGLLYDNVIHLGTFMIDSYAANTKEMNAIVTGYDVIYDIKNAEIKLLYKVMITNDSVTTLYRVDTDLYEDFDVYEFIIDLTSQLTVRLRQGLRMIECEVA